MSPVLAYFGRGADPIYLEITSSLGAYGASLQPGGRWSYSHNGCSYPKGAPLPANEAMAVLMTATTAVRSPAMMMLQEPFESEEWSYWYRIAHEKLTAFNQAYADFKDRLKVPAPSSSRTPGGHWLGEQIAA